MLDCARRRAVSGSSRSQTAPKLSPFDFPKRVQRLSRLGWKSPNRSSVGPKDHQGTWRRCIRRLSGPFPHEPRVTTRPIPPANATHHKQQNTGDDPSSASAFRLWRFVGHPANLRAGPAIRWVITPRRRTNRPASKSGPSGSPASQAYIESTNESGRSCSGRRAAPRRPLGCQAS
jgi:hypothetical protein